MYCLAHPLYWIFYSNRYNPAKNILVFDTGIISEGGESTPIGEISDIEISGGRQTFTQWICGYAVIVITSKGAEKDKAVVAVRTGFEWLLWVLRIRSGVRLFSLIRTEIFSSKSVASATRSVAGLQAQAKAALALEEEIARQRAEKANVQGGGQ